MHPINMLSTASQTNPTGLVLEQNTIWLKLQTSTENVPNSEAFDIKFLNCPAAMQPSICPTTLLE
jgi:hypothetical protein